jgi:hypothetical protein
MNELIEIEESPVKIEGVKKQPLNRKFRVRIKYTKIYSSKDTK